MIAWARRALTCALLAGVVTTTTRAVHAADKPSIRMETPTTRIIPDPMIARRASAPERTTSEPKPPTAPSFVRHSFYFELLGNGGLYSLNYELLVGRAGVRVGGSYFAMKADGGIGDTQVAMASFPTMLEYRVLGTTHALEVGAGVSTFLLQSKTRVLFSRVASSNVLLAATATLGYRYKPRDGGLVFRAGLTPLVALMEGLPWLPSVGMSIGGQTS